MEKGTKNGKPEEERERETVWCLLSPSLLTTQEKAVYKTKYSTQPPDFPCDRLIRVRPNFRFLYRNRVSSRLIRIDPREIIRRLGSSICQ